jgi:F-type H+-transporting ATPase subunit b
VRALLAGIALVSLLAGPAAHAQPRDDRHGEEEPAVSDTPGAGGHEGGEAEEEGPQPINFANCHAATIPIGAMFLNFALLLAIVLRLGRTPIQDMLRGRHLAIKEALEEAQRIHSEAEARYREYSVRLETLDQEVTRLRTEMAAAGQAERDRLVAEAKERAERLQRETEFLLGQELKQLRVDLEREVAEAAVQAAEETLRKVTDRDDQERLAEDYLKALRGADRGGVS